MKGGLFLFFLPPQGNQRPVAGDGMRSRRPGSFFFAAPWLLAMRGFF
jgi:hypothetical protein